MAYRRVIPRDLFNEANLLKCLGKIVLDIEDGKLPWLSYWHDNEAFNVVQDENSGAIYCSNIQFFAGKKTLPCFTRPLNSRDHWPLYLEMPWDSLPVFDDHGNVILTLELVQS